MFNTGQHFCSQHGPTSLQTVLYQHSNFLHKMVAEKALQTLLKGMAE